MAVLPPIRRLLLEDFATQKAWIEPLLIVENNFAESVVNVLNKNLTLHDNTTGDIITLSLSSVPTAAAPASINWAKANKPIAVIPGQVSIIGGATPTLTGPLGVQWQLNGNSIQITNLFGITPSSTNQVVLTLVVFTG